MAHLIVKATISISAALFILAAYAGLCPAETAVRYEVEFKGIDNGDLTNELSSASSTVAFKENPPPSLALLRRRAQADIPRLLQALKAEGYYDAKADVDVIEDHDPVIVRFQIDPGPAYRIESAEIEARESEAGTPVKLPSVEDLGLRIGEPARAQQILSGRESLIKKLREKGYPFVAVETPKVVVNHETHAVSVAFELDPGPPARFGDTSFTGIESVKESFLKGRVPWRKGEPFNAALFSELQTRLTKTGLFSLIRISHGESLNDAGLLPIVVELRERKHRTFSAGASYYTDKGPGGKVAWENRNLLHGGERLRIEAGASQIGYEGEGSFRKPAFLRDDQLLLLTARLAYELTDAYQSRNTEFAVIVEREPRKGFTFGAGPGFRLARVEQDAATLEGINGEEDFALLSFPSYLNWDTSDNPLNPSRGGRLKVQLTPYQDVLAEHVGFLKTYSSYTRYYMLSGRPPITLAGRAAVGMISGADLESIPADVRFYAGGGASIRGYPFQSVGPLFEDEPIGGRSILELSTELRMRVTERFGFVAFLDGGSAFESVVPDFSEELLWGAGGGLRYFSPVGPLRLDVAFPLNRREPIDDPFQVYVSIGQAF